MDDEEMDGADDEKDEDDWMVMNLDEHAPEGRKKEGIGKRALWKGGMLDDDGVDGDDKRW